MKVKIRDNVKDGLDSAAHVYNVGSNIGTQFVLGNIGVKDDFWLVGLEVKETGAFPMLTGVILGEDGLPLINLVDGQITFNPQHCDRIFQSSNEGFSYLISAPNGATVLQVETRLTPSSALGGAHTLSTRIVGQFYDRSGSVLVDVTHDYAEVSDSTIALLAGQHFAVPMIAHQVEFIKIHVFTRGIINHILSGHYEGQELSIDGAYLYDFSAKDCELKFANGFWPSSYSQPVIENTSYAAKGMAAHIAQSSSGAEGRLSGVELRGIRDRDL